VPDSLLPFPSCLFTGDGVDNTCLKVHTRKEAFEVEVKVLTELAVTRSIEQHIPKLDVVSKVDMAATMPFYPATLATANFSGELFASACHGAAQVLPWLHQNHLAYCDPSPANVLVVGKKAVWNDFADVEQLGATLTAFRGTPAFTSLAMDRLAHGPAKDHAYTEQDDAQAVFFTLLSFVWFDGHHKRLLPWAAGTAKLMPFAKLDFVHNPGDWLDHVQDVAKITMASLFAAVFPKEGDTFSSEVAWATLARAQVRAATTDNPKTVYDSNTGTRYHRNDTTHARLYINKRTTVCESSLRPCANCWPDAPTCGCPKCAAESETQGGS
jgi:hypothetical protein